VFDYPHFPSSHTHNGDDTILRPRHVRVTIFAVEKQKILYIVCVYVCEVILP